ncbi:MAG: molybdate ABC transporter substrate-binding protein [Chloroflexota bacterium]|nr:molybdate ABC transporter substrate-binding protein [Chloroflexota bacterium]
MSRAGLKVGAGVIAVALAAIVLLPSASAPIPATAAPAAQDVALTVFAAASLTDALKEIGAAFEANTGIPVAFNFGASSQLRTQLEQGARADVFASADQVQMDRAREAGLIAGPDATFAANRLVVITPADNPAGIRSAADLALPGVRVVTAAPEVPIGAYTQQMFEKMSQLEAFGADFQERANANVVSREPNVRQVVAKIQLGEGDAAVVYLSDVTPSAAPNLQTIAIPDDLNTIASYPIALVAGAPRAELGAAFIALVLSPVGQGILESWNFSPVGPTATTPAGPAARPLVPSPSIGALAPVAPAADAGDPAPVR